MKKSVISIVLVLFLLMLFACSHKTNSTALDADGDSGTGTTSRNKPSSPSGGGGSGGNASIPKSSPNYQPLPSTQEPSSDLDPSSQESLGSDSEPLGQDPSETASSSQNPSDSDSSTPTWGPGEPNEKWRVYDFSTEEDDEIFIINLFNRSLPSLGIKNPDRYELKYDLAEYTANDVFEVEPGVKYTSYKFDYVEPGPFPIGIWRNMFEGDDEWLIFTENTVSSYSRWFAHAKYSYIISGNKIRLSFIEALETDEEAGTKQKIYQFWPNVD
jgi:hypothetical protein